MGAVVGYVIFLPVLPAMPPPLLVALPFLVALGAVWGDLFESALKREFGTKDAGTWLPGFGGLLDRIDSLILVVPLVYYLFRAAGLLRGMSDGREVLIGPPVQADPIRERTGETLIELLDRAVERDPDARVS